MNLAVRHETALRARLADCMSDHDSQQNAFPLVRSNMSLNPLRTLSSFAGPGLAAAFAVAIPVVAAAQNASVSAVVVSGRHELLGNPLAGGAVGFSFPRRDTRFSLHIEAAFSRGSSGRTDVPCTGLIQPGTCAPEQVRDQAWLASASGGATFPVLRGSHASMAFTANLTLASLGVDSRGLSSGQTLSASKLLWGGLAGANANWTPVARVPFALQVAGEIGGLMPIVEERVEDGYTPFERGFDLRRVRLGIVWRP